MLFAVSCEILRPFPSACWFHCFISETTEDVSITCAVESFFLRIICLFSVGPNSSDKCPHVAVTMIGLLNFFIIDSKNFLAKDNIIDHAIV